MSGEAWLYLFAVIINAVNLFLQVFFTIMYSDLEWYGIPDKQNMGGFGLQPASGQVGSFCRFAQLRHPLLPARFLAETAMLTSRVRAATTSTLLTSATA